MPSIQNTVRGAWALDSAIDFLNHGSFGACPVAVLDEQARLREELEREPVRFMVRELESRLDAARTQLATFLGADPDGLAFVPNATTGVNAVLRSLEFRPGDELLTTDHEYNACRNALEFAARRYGAAVVVAQIPFPVRGPADVIDAILQCVSPRTHLALIDHVTSQTALILPIRSLVEALAERGIDVLVDGAHAPGMLQFRIDAIGAAYYTGNCHKWICAPKGAGFLHVRADRRKSIRPTVISHGANSTRTDRERFRAEFDWTGTFDPTPYLCVPVALRHLASLAPGGWPEVMERNRRLALRGRAILCKTLDIAAPTPDDMIGSMASLPLPDGSADAPTTSLYDDPLQRRLFEEHRIEVPIIAWPSTPRRLIRISAQLYNDERQYARLADALDGMLRT